MEKLINRFKEIAVEETSDSAAKFLKASNWNVEEALSLFYHSQNQHPQSNMINKRKTNPPPESNINVKRNRNQQYNANVHHDNGLDQLYPPCPVALIHKGSFGKSKSDATSADKWLIVNIQSNKDFNSNMLNAHTWSNKILEETIRQNFVFWQIYNHMEEGKKVSTFYKLDSLPITMVIDPVTGLRMRCWRGMVEAETLMEDLTSFIDKSPKNTPNSTYKAVISDIHRIRRH